MSAAHMQQLAGGGASKAVCRDPVLNNKPPGLAVHRGCSWIAFHGALLAVMC